MSHYCVVFLTAPQGPEAKRLAKLLLKKKLAACVNIVKGVESLFWWQGKIDKAKESLMMAKTQRRLVPAIIGVIKKSHSYEVCEIIALPIIAGNPDYLKWITASCRKGQGL